MTSGWKGALYFRRYGRESWYRNQQLRRKKFGGGYRSTTVRCPPTKVVGMVVGASDFWVPLQGSLIKPVSRYKAVRNE